MPLYSVRGEPRSCVTAVVRIVQGSGRGREAPWTLRPAEYDQLPVHEFGILTSSHGWDIGALVASAHGQGFVLVGRVIGVHDDVVRNVAVIRLTNEFAPVESILLIPEIFVDLPLPFGAMHRAADRRRLTWDPVELVVDDQNLPGRILEVDFAIVTTRVNYRHQILVALHEPVPPWRSGAVLLHRTVPIAQLVGKLMLGPMDLVRYPGRPFEHIYVFTPLPFLFDAAALAATRGHATWEPLVRRESAPTVGVTLPLDTDDWQDCTYCGAFRSNADTAANLCRSCFHHPRLTDVVIPRSSA